MKADNIAALINGPVGATTYAAHSSTAKSISCEQVIDAMRAALKALDEAEPFFRFMTERGHSPNDGWRLYVPAAWVATYGPLPRYVVAHNLGGTIGIVAVNERNLRDMGWGDLNVGGKLAMGARL